MLERKNIEVEVRSFVSPQEWKRLRRFFDAHAKFLGTRHDETVYVRAPKDLRLRQDDQNAYVILKEGKIHDPSRREFEIPFPRSAFSELEALFIALGFPPKVRWYRTSRIYKWKGTKVFLWHTKGYGLLIELEVMATERTKRAVHARLLELFEELGIAQTPRNVFEKRLAYYLKHWKRLTRGSKSIVFPK